VGEDALRVARELAAGIDPLDAARRAGASFQEAGDGAGHFEFEFVSGEALVTWPALEPSVTGASPLPPHIAALLVYYLGRARDIDPAGRWVSFAELPDGGVYVEAFRGYTAGTLVRHFAGNPEALTRAAKSLGGELVPGMADRAWRFAALPRVPVALLWWDADDEFPARAELLFDATASHHLPTDGCAILGSWLTQALIGAVQHSG
jgi:hypothetical protein